MRKITLYIFALSFFVCSSFVAQKSVEWASLEYGFVLDWQFDSEFGTWVKAPIFESSTKALEGKKITLKGYIIPANQFENKYYISKNPNASCFFCNKAGKGTVVYLNLKNNRTFEVDEFIKVQGTFGLSDSYKEMPYRLDNVVIIKE